MAKRKSSDETPSEDAKLESEETVVVDTDSAKDEGSPDADETLDANDVTPTSDEGPQTEDLEPSPDDQQSEIKTEDEPEAPPEPETEVFAPPVATLAEPARRTALPLIFGGVVAAFIGFLAARGEILDPILPHALRAKGPDAALAERLDTVTTRLAALETAVGALPEPQAPIPTDLSPIDAKLSALSDRVDVLANRPVVTTDVPQEALNAALADLRATAKAQQDEINRLLADARLVKDDAQASANATLARAAATRIQSAVDSGAPFANALGDLEAAGETDIPDALRNTAQAGVIPLAELQATIPDAARAALDAARGAESSGGLTGFLERQLGVRSVQPREGADPDAVLSRIEAAARAGRLGDALAEAETLPDPAKDALRAWTEQAQSRLDAVIAANALAERLSAL